METPSNWCKWLSLSTTRTNTERPGSIRRTYTRHRPPSPPSILFLSYGIETIRMYIVKITHSHRKLFDAVRMYTITIAHQHKKFGIDGENNIFLYCIKIPCGML